MSNISLPDALHAAAEEWAARAGFASADEYVADLVRRDVEQRAQENPDFYLRRALAGDGDPASVPQEVVDRRQREIEALLIEGLDSGPATPMTAEDWQALRR